MTAIDFRTNPVTSRRAPCRIARTHANMPDIVWADDETGRYAVWGKDAKGNRIVVKRAGPIRIVGARR